MQWLVDLVIEAIGVPPCYVDRGDPAAADFSHADFTEDGNWHDLDLSGIVPEGTSAVAIALLFSANNASEKLRFKTKGNANNSNSFLMRTQVANIYHDGQGIVKVDADRKIEYQIDVSGAWAIFFTVIGWWL